MEAKDKEIRYRQDSEGKETEVTNLMRHVREESFIRKDKHVECPTT